MLRTLVMGRVSIAAASVSSAKVGLAIAIAQEGGIGIVHRNLPIAAQAREVDKVKKSESGMISDPVTVRPEQPIHEALEIMRPDVPERLDGVAWRGVEPAISGLQRVFGGRSPSQSKKGLMTTDLGRKGPESRSSTTKSSCGLPSG